MPTNVLVIGGGGREHALSWKLSQSPMVNSVYVSPGNTGTAHQSKTFNCDLDVTNKRSVVEWVAANQISLVVVGPEAPLADGIVDVISDAGIPCFGPTAQAAKLESSKAFAKHFMKRHNIPTPRYLVFSDAQSAKHHIVNASYDALVVKASGLASGKGVIVAESTNEACQAVDDILEKKLFGKAGEEVVVEELLKGEEVSCLAFTDGETVACLPPTQDHKRLLEGDKGPNTGGMGAYCPYPLISSDQLKYIEVEIIQKTIKALKSEGIEYKGILYAGIMLTNDGPEVLEYNCRFGDPETQVILPLMVSDLYETCVACTNHTLSSNMPRFRDGLKSLGIILASPGYPSKYKKGLVITGLEKDRENVRIFHSGTSSNADGHLVTSGGRVLIVQALGENFHDASDLANKVSAEINFEGRHYRRDIGHRVLTRISPLNLTYKKSGVDIGAGNQLVENIKPLCLSTSRTGCMSNIGSFGAVFDLKLSGYKDALLISGTDGVGTKLKISQEYGHHRFVGHDLVAMCVNDVLVHGAEPLFFLDYFASNKLDVAVVMDIVAGVADGCKLAGCALVGGETAELPGLYHGGCYDVAGFVVGAVERGHELPRISEIVEGDIVIGIQSSGLHSNGFSLVRMIVEKLGFSYHDSAPFCPSHSLGHELLTPTKIYVKSILPLMRSGKVKAACHITGGGLLENIPRSLPDNLSVILDAKSWTVPAVFSWIAQMGNVHDEEMLRTFNCGIGMVLIIGEENRSFVIDLITSSGENCTKIGKVVRNDGPRVQVLNLKSVLTRQIWTLPPRTVISRKRVAVLISGTGSNLQALIDHCKSPLNESSAEIALVVSNKDGVFGLERAAKAGIPSVVIRHKDYPTREKFDAFIDARLTEAGIEIVCLAGFMRILSGWFVNKWKGRILNTHPSLLPSFKGANAHKQVLQAGVRISGCTIHFVTEEVDCGAIVIQEAVPVNPDDTEQSLSERVKSQEHRAFPKALEMVACGEVALENGVSCWKTKSTK